MTITWPDLALNTRVTVVRSDRGNTGKAGTIERYAWGFHFPYYVRLDDGRMILTNDVGVQPVETYVLTDSEITQ